MILVHGLTRKASLWLSLHLFSLFFWVWCDSNSCFECHTMMVYNLELWAKQYKTNHQQKKAFFPTSCFLSEYFLTSVEVKLGYGTISPVAIALFPMIKCWSRYVPHITISEHNLYGWPSLHCMRWALYSQTLVLRDPSSVEEFFIGFFLYPSYPSPFSKDWVKCHNIPMIVLLFFINLASLS